MSAEFVPGVTFATGGTYTAGHFNDYVRSATVAGIDRANVNFTLGVFITRNANQPPAPTDRELFANSNSLEIVSSFFTGAFVTAFRGTEQPRFTNANGDISVGETTRSTTAGGTATPIVIRSVAETISSASGINKDMVGIAQAANASGLCFIQVSGTVTVRVSGIVTCGDLLVINFNTGNPSDNAPPGALIVNNDRRGSGQLGIDEFASEPFQFCQAIGNKTTAGLGFVLARVCV